MVNYNPKLANPSTFEYISSPFSIEIKSLTIEFKFFDFVQAQFHMFRQEDLKFDSEFVTDFQLKSEMITKSFKILL